MSKNVEFHEWYGKWWSSRESDDITQPLYECMLDAFIKGRDIEREAQEREIELLKSLLKDCLLYIDDIVGIASEARSDIENYLQLGAPCPHGYFDSDLCPDCRH